MGDRAETELFCCFNCMVLVYLTTGPIVNAFYLLQIYSSDNVTGCKLRELLQPTAP